MNKYEEAIDILKCFEMENSECGNLNCERQSPECAQERAEAFDVAYECLEKESKVINKKMRGRGTRRNLMNCLSLKYRIQWIVYKLLHWKKIKKLMAKMDHDILYGTSGIEPKGLMRAAEEER